MDITVTRESGWVIARVAGRLDGTTMQAAESELLALIGQGERRMLLDLTALEYISSAGLRVLLSAAKKMKASGGTIALFGLSANVREIFRLSGFDKIFSIYESQEEALGQAGG